MCGHFLCMEPVTLITRPAVARTRSRASLDDEPERIHATLFSPDIRSLPEVGDHGLWNIVNTDQVHADHFTEDFAGAQRMNKWLESMDNLGPRYFYGYIPHLHNTPRDSLRSKTHNALTGTDDERSFLTEQAREKGMVFTGIWNEYAESIVMEPANNVGAPPDEHAAWRDGRPVFLDNFTARKIPVPQPKELMTENREGRDTSQQ